MNARRGFRRLTIVIWAAGLLGLAGLTGLVILTGTRILFGGGVFSALAEFLLLGCVWTALVVGICLVVSWVIEGFSNR